MFTRLFAPATDDTKTPRLFCRKRNVDPDESGSGRGSYGHNFRCCGRMDRKGRLVRHAGSCLSAAIFPLTITVVEAAFRAALMPAVGAAVLLKTCSGAATWAAIALAPITMATD